MTTWARLPAISCSGFPKTSSGKKESGKAQETLPSGLPGSEQGKWFWVPGLHWAGSLAWGTKGSSSSGFPGRVCPGSPWPADSTFWFGSSPFLNTREAGVQASGDVEIIQTALFIGCCVPSSMLML